MATQINLPFSSDEVDRLSDLNRLRFVLDALPDSDIIDALREMHGRGRNEYPVRPMWRAFIAGVVFQHSSVESLIRELKRNSTLLDICGFSPVPLHKRAKYGISPGGVVTVTDYPARSPVPGSHNFSRFLSNVARLEQERGLISKMIEDMGDELMELLPDFGRKLGYDGKE